VWKNCQVLFEWPHTQHKKWIWNVTFASSIAFSLMSYLMKTSCRTRVPRQVKNKNIWNVEKPIFVLRSNTFVRVIVTKIDLYYFETCRCCYKFCNVNIQVYLNCDNKIKKIHMCVLLYEWELRKKTNFLIVIKNNNDLLTIHIVWSRISLWQQSRSFTQQKMLLT